MESIYKKFNKCHKTTDSIYKQFNAWYKKNYSVEIEWDAKGRYFKARFTFFVTINGKRIADPIIIKAKFKRTDLFENRSEFLKFQANCMVRGNYTYAKNSSFRNYFFNKDLRDLSIPDTMEMRKTYKPGDNYNIQPASMFLAQQLLNRTYYCCEQGIDDTCNLFLANTMNKIVTFMNNGSTYLAKNYMQEDAFKDSVRLFLVAKHLKWQMNRPCVPVKENILFFSSKLRRSLFCFLLVLQRNPRWKRIMTNLKELVLSFMQQPRYAFEREKIDLKQLFIENYSKKK